MIRLWQKLSRHSKFLLEDIFAFISSPICPGCECNIESNRRPLCDKCNYELRGSFHGDGPLCLRCRAPEGISCACSVDEKYPTPRFYYWSQYTELMRALLHRFKFEGEQRLGQYLTSIAWDIMADRLVCLKFDRIVVVPMRVNDKRERGFNQTELIAQIISEKMAQKPSFNLLIKIKSTRLQAKLGADERWSNVRDVFRVDAVNHLTGESILLIDDIITTGATCYEASRALYEAGASKVTVFAIACADDLGRKS